MTSLTSHGILRLVINKTAKMKYNPEEYETVKSRKERFYKDHVDGRIFVELINSPEAMSHVIFKAQVFMSREDQEKGCARGTGYALEVRDTEKTMGKNGLYESVNYSSWTENCEESAVGRALGNAGYSGNKKPSREEMIKADKMNTTMTSYNAPKTDSTIHNDQLCPRCKGRVIEGTTKTGKGYFKCENAKWDSKLQKNVGCQFIEWINEEPNF